MKIKKKYIEKSPYCSDPFLHIDVYVLQNFISLKKLILMHFAYNFWILFTLLHIVAQVLKKNQVNLLGTKIGMTTMFNITGLCYNKNFQLGDSILCWSHITIMFVSLVQIIKYIYGSYIYNDWQCVFSTVNANLLDTVLVHSYYINIKGTICSFPSLFWSWLWLSRS